MNIVGKYQKQQDKKYEKKTMILMRKLSYWDLGKRWKMRDVHMYTFIHTHTHLHTHTQYTYSYTHKTTPHMQMLIIQDFQSSGTT